MDRRPRRIPRQGDEATLLPAYLDRQRETFRRVAGDLDRESLSRTLPPASMTLGGMVKHLAHVEGWWFGQVFRGEPAPEPFTAVDWEVDRDWDWRSSLDDDPVELWALYEEMVGRSRAAVDTALAGEGLDATSVRTGRDGTPFSLRWILLHMLEEYARHLGHADLIRESVDGRTGL
jgi:hypothetical protein